MLLTEFDTSFLKMSILRKVLCLIYFALAIAGALFPTLANIDFMRVYGPGFDITQFIELANNNPAAESLSRDLMISATAICVWIFSESRRLRMKHLWIVILGTFTIAFAFSAPLFLLLRERRLYELEKEGLNIDLPKNKVGAL